MNQPEQARAAAEELETIATLLDSAGSEFLNWKGQLFTTAKAVQQYVADAVAQAVKDYKYTIEQAERMISAKAEEIARLRQQKAGETLRANVYLDKIKDMKAALAVSREELTRLRDCHDPLDPCRDCLKCLKEEVETQVRIQSKAAVAAERERWETWANKVDALDFSPTFDAKGSYSKRKSEELDALKAELAALRAPGRPADTMLNTPITEAERDRISKDGP